MRTRNLISAEIPDALLADVLARIRQIESDLAPYTSTLNRKTVHKLYKMSDKSVAFVEKILIHTEQNPELVPSWVSREELLKDYHLNRQMKQMLGMLRQLSRTVEDTAILAGSEAITAGLAFYSNVKEAARIGVPGSESIQNDLKHRFARSGRMTAGDSADEETDALLSADEPE